MTSVLVAKGDANALFEFGDDRPRARRRTGESRPLLTFSNAAEPVVSAFDLSVLRGDGIFEATTIWKGRPLSLTNHLRRLQHSASLDDLPDIVIPAFRDAVDELYEQYDGSKEGPRVRIIVSRGLSPYTGMVVPNAQRYVPNVWFILDGVHADHPLDAKSIISLTRGYPSDIQTRAPWLLTGVKTLSYAFNEAVHRECARRSVDDAVLVTEDGYVLEGPNSTYVARFGNVFVTPDPRIGILHGTSQRELFAYARQHGFDFRYDALPLSRFREADRIYLTHESTVLPVRELDGVAVDYDPVEIREINDAIWSGQTERDALDIRPEGLV